MKRLKYLPIIALIFGSCLVSCEGENIKPGTGGDEDEDPIILPLPKEPEKD